MNAELKENLIIGAFIFAALIIIVTYTVNKFSPSSVSEECSRLRDCEFFRCQGKAVVGFGSEQQRDWYHTYYSCLQVQNLSRDGIPRGLS